MMCGFFAKNAAVMRPILLFAILLMGFPLSGASAATELETLRARCIEQERQIQELEAKLEKLQPGSSQPAAPIAAKIPVATVVPEPAAAPTGKTHKIQANDTYSSISRKYSVTIEALVAANPGVKPTALRPGQTIQLPSDAPATKSQSASVDSPPPATPVEKTETAATPAPAGTSSSAKKIRSIMIETEMTYANFANQHGTDTGRLNDLNGLDLTDATVLAKGSELYVPQ